MAEQNCYGDGTVFRGVRSKDSEIGTKAVKPLDGDQIIDAWEHLDPVFREQRLICFVQGIRFAEKYHGINHVE